MRGMRTKTSTIYQEILKTDYDGIILTETWLNSDVYDHEFIDQRYSVFRRDRWSSAPNSDKRGGGVLIAIKKQFKAVRVQSWESACEDIWLLIDINDTRLPPKQIALCCVYIPPPPKLDMLKTFLNSCNLVRETVDETVIVGDLNLSFINWTRDSVTNGLVPENYECNLGFALVDYMNLNDITQRNHVLNANNRILDLVLTNIPDVSVVKPDDLLSRLDSHHPQLQITFDLSLVCNLQKTFRNDHNFYKADYDNI
jgi:hypothetical protein